MEYNYPIMSKAYLGDDDYGQELPLKQREISPNPNYLTPQGQKKLTEDLKSLETEKTTLITNQGFAQSRDRLQYLERDITYLKLRLNSAIVVEPKKQPPNKVAFGAIVTATDNTNQETTYQIVGEDEANPGEYKISYTSPLGKVLLDTKVGDTVIWQRPKGDLSLLIKKIEY